MEKLFPEIANEHAPLKIKRAKGSKTPWVTSKLTEMKRDKDYHLRKARSTNSTYHWGMYRKLRNYTNHEEKNLKSKYFCQMIEDAKGDSCEMWCAIKQVLPGTKQSTVSSLFENGKWHWKSLHRHDYEPVLCVNGESTNKTISKHFDCFYFWHSFF